MTEIIVRDGGNDLKLPLEPHAERAMLIQLDENGTLHFRYVVVPLVSIERAPMGGRRLRVG